MGHEVVTAADPGDPLDVRSPMHRDVLAERVGFADFGSRRLALVAEVLRIRANYGAGSDPIPGPDHEWADQVHVWADFAPGFNRNCALDDRERANPHIRGDCGFR